MRDTSFTSHRSETAPIQALRSLTEAQATVIEAGLPSGWSVDRHTSYDGHLSLVVTNWAADEAPSYTVDRDGLGLHLGRLHGDAFGRLGSFAETGELVRALVRALAEMDGRTTPHAA